MLIGVCYAVHCPVPPPCCLQYVVETRFVGERELGTGHAEIVDVKERIVEVAQPGPTCPANTGMLYCKKVSSVSALPAVWHVATRV